MLTDHQEAIIADDNRHEIAAQRDLESRGAIALVGYSLHVESRTLTINTMHATDGRRFSHAYDGQNPKTALRAFCQQHHGTGTLKYKNHELADGYATASYYVFN